VFDVNGWFRFRQRPRGMTPIRLLPLALLLLLPGCRDEVFRWHQKITITVETPSGPVSGHAVQSLEVVKALNGYAGQPPGSATELRGEAVAVELAPGRWLFLLLEGTDVWLLPSLVRPGLGEYAGYGVRTIEVLRAVGDLPTGTVLPIPPEGMPRMVTFGDVADPTSVRLVDPQDLDASFGCDRYDPALAPWRAEGKSYRVWAEEEKRRRAYAMAGERAGLPERIARIVEEYQHIVDRDSGNEKARRIELADLSTVDQRREWKTATWALLKELPPPPTLEERTAASGGPCYRLSSATLETTDEDVTEGRVEAVLGWICQYIRPFRRLSGKSDPIDDTDLANNLGPSVFSIGLCRQ
jgi:hypothetical protein